MENKTSKYFKYALGEIILVVVGILIALQVNNWNETRIERHRIEDFAKSLIQDLKSDIFMLKISQEQAAAAYHRIDSLKNYMYSTPVKNISNTVLFILTDDDLYRPFKWNRSTFDELKSSGSMRYITNDSIENKLVQYEAFSRHLDEDFIGDNNRSNYAEQLLVKVVNFNSPYITRMIQAEDPEINPIVSDYFSSPHFEASKINDLPLVSYDETLLLELTNFYITIQDELATRAFLELPEIIGDAEELIALLREEYQIKS